VLVMANQQFEIPFLLPETQDTRFMFSIHKHVFEDSLMREVRRLSLLYVYCMLSKRFSGVDLMLEVSNQTNYFRLELFLSIVKLLIRFR
jgi:hypothetical protein